MEELKEIACLMDWWPVYRVSWLSPNYSWDGPLSPIILSCKKWMVETHLEYFLCSFLLVFDQPDPGADTRFMPVPIKSSSEHLNIFFSTGETATTVPQLHDNLNVFPKLTVLHLIISSSSWCFESLWNFSHPNMMVTVLVLVYYHDPTFSHWWKSLM